MECGMRKFTVTCEWDDEAHVWYVSESNVPGLVAEAATVEDMNDVLRERVPELLKLNLPELFQQGGDREIPLEVITKQHNNLRLAS